MNGSIVQGVVLASSSYQSVAEPSSRWTRFRLSADSRLEQAPLVRRLEAPADRIHVAMVRDLGDQLLAVTGQDVDHAARDVAGGADLREGHRGEWIRRADHRDDDVAARKHRSDRRDESEQDLRFRGDRDADPRGLGSREVVYGPLTGLRHPRPAGTCRTSRQSDESVDRGVDLLDRRGPGRCPTRSDARAADRVDEFLAPTSAISARR